MLNGAAQAAFEPISWNFYNQSGGAGGRTYVNGDDYQLHVTAWSDTGGSNYNRIERADLEDSGINRLRVQNNIENSGSNDHSIDNDYDCQAYDSNGNCKNWTRNTDFMLFEIRDDNGALVDDFSLTDITVGWASTDSELTILAYDGTASDVETAIKGEKISGLQASSDWLQVKKNTGGTKYSSTYHKNFNSGLITSSYWIVGAAFPSWNDGKHDYVKLASAAGGINREGGHGVPAPAPLLLMAMGIPLLSRRRRNGRESVWWPDSNRAQPAPRR